MQYLCFKNSSFDIDTHFYDKNSFDTLVVVLNHLNEMDGFVDSNSIKNSPDNDKIICKINKTNFIFSSLNHSNCYRTSRLFYFYSKLDARFKTLAFCFHYLAKLSKLDQIDLNMIPSHSFTLMTCYFLQNLEPKVIPCLHEVIFEANNNNPCINMENTSFDYDLFERKKGENM